MEKTHSPRVRTGYYPNGITKRYELYLLEGGTVLSISWDKNGNKIAEITWDFIHRVQDYKLAQCSNTEDFLEKFNFEDSTAEGEFLFWYENGQLACTGEVYDKSFEGDLIRWHSNGNKYKESFCVNGKLHGINKMYYENGNLELELEYQNGVETGIYRQYHENGNKQIYGAFFEGKKNRKFTSWYKNGQIHEESNWVLDSLEGDFRLWDEKGDLIEETFYVDGKEHWKKKKTGNVYLMKNARNGYIKIGFTKNKPEFREKTFQSEEPEVELIKDWKGTMLDEEKLHEKFTDKRLRGEWFDLNADDIKQIEEYFNG